MNTVARFIDDESGATAIEYGLIAALIAVAIIAGATLLGGSLDALFTSISGTLDGVAPEDPPAEDPPPPPPAG
jgi:pilus assembly protein Flp/PilA